jgi:hypothetical protein
MYGIVSLLLANTIGLITVLIDYETSPTENLSEPFPQFPFRSLAALHDVVFKSVVGLFDRLIQNLVFDFCVGLKRHFYLRFGVPRLIV